MDRLTDSERTFLECFEIVAKRPYLGCLAGAALFLIGYGLFSTGMEHDQPRRVLLGGLFFGTGLFEILESYLAYRLYGILEKLKGPAGGLVP